jgi:Ulp1 family protease
MAAYIRQEALHRKGEILPTEAWPVLYPTDIPAQTDDHSCGVYAMVFAECLAAGYPLQHCGISNATAVPARARLLHFLQASMVFRADMLTCLRHIVS